VLVVTRGIPEIFPPQIIEETRGELRQAHALLGVSETAFLDFPAPALDTVPGYQLAQAVSAQVRQWQPETVYCPHYGDIHGDHQRVFEAALVACRPVGECPVKRLLCYETPSETDWAPPPTCQTFSPTVFVDISAYLSLKLQAMACYATQIPAQNHPRSPQTLEALARVRGATVNVAAAEGFELVREIRG
jgi:N-acetylglucosamine malate deacetylase 1